MELAKEKIAMYGAKNASDSELLSAVFGPRIAQKLSGLGSIREIFSASTGDLQKRGIGAAKALQIKALLELAKRFLQNPLRSGMQISSSNQVAVHYQTKLVDEKKEHFYCLLLDTRHKVMSEYLISIGSLNYAVVHPREIFAPAIRESAAAILMVHNHPSGDPTPSREDIYITKRLREVGKIVGIEILDHIIVSHDNRYTSFKEQRII